MPLVRRDIQPLEDAENRRQLDRREGLRRWRRSEVQTDSRLLGLDLSGRMEVSREDEVRSLRDEECETGWQFERSPAKSPPPKSTGHARDRVVVRRIRSATTAQQSS